jgi:hypothetical protein
MAVMAALVHKRQKVARLRAHRVSMIPHVDVLKTGKTRRESAGDEQSRQRRVADNGDQDDDGDYHGDDEPEDDDSEDEPVVNDIDANDFPALDEAIFSQRGLIYGERVVGRINNSVAFSLISLGGFDSPCHPGHPNFQLCNISCQRRYFCYGRV